MKCLNASAIEAAERFVWLSGRLLDRHRFAHLFRGADRTPALATLRAYQNPDGGFGHGLEPDLRGPISQPQPVELALRLLDEWDAMDDPMVAGACDYLVSITRSEGGVPFVLPSARAYPRGPWWEAGDEPPASLNPTAAIAGLLHRHRVGHPWLAPATAFCWERLERLERTETYEARCVLLFLEYTPDRPRAEAVLDRVGGLIEAQRLVALDPADISDELPSPLDLVPGPDSLAAGLFSRDVVDAHLDALVAAQREDGGWPVDWEIWTPATGLEWRSWVTTEALKTLRAYGRWRS
ncbi:MAG TPA: hypothetical protein VOB72_01960 [Candidatus Dormibacteraeota bacterium]|nr:hypothetical protein [Candidatus Dormibacteraeota bacterium]